MDREVIEQKLESLRRCLRRVAEKCPPDPATLGRDHDLQDIVTLNLTRMPTRVRHLYFLPRKGVLFWIVCTGLLAALCVDGLMQACCGIDILSLKISSRWDNLGRRAC
jgi:hypothetical protein